MNLLVRKNGVWVCAVGVVIFLLNFLTYSLWEIDIDILGAVLIVLGLVIVVACGASMKSSSGLLTRKSGVWLCIIAVVITMLLSYSPIPILNGEVVGFSGLVVFVLGVLLILIRWKY